MAIPLFRGKLENKDGFIIVEKYHRDKFEKHIQCVCDNCNQKRTHKQVYELHDGTGVGICCHCSKKIHNCNTRNLRYRKYLENPKAD